MTELTFSQIDNTVIDTLKPPPKKYWLLLLLLLAGVGCRGGQLDIPDFRRNRRGRPEPSGRLGDLPDQLRVLGRYRPLRNADFRHPAPVPCGMEKPHRPSRGNHDRVRRLHRGPFSVHPSRPGLDGLLHAADPQPEDALAQLHVSADVRRGGDQHVFDREQPVLVHGHASGLGGDSRPDNGREKEDLHHHQSGLVRPQRPVAALHAGLPLFRGPGHAFGHLGPLGGVLGLRPRGRSRLAHHHIRALFRGGRHPFRAGHGADPP